ncbi:MAG: hypothetical protein WAK17_24285 [Candidatus Nitrosopolaris sp.]
MRGKVSERLIHDCLDEKYKEKYRVENARKRKRKHQVPEDCISRYKQVAARTRETKTADSCYAGW